MDVSVLLPYRDCAPTIAEALTSVLADRACSNSASRTSGGASVSLEVIAVDDGSTDGGRDVLERTAGGDPRVVSLRTSGGDARPSGERSGVGIVGALELALAHARGRFVARMDGDDVSLPGRFAAQLEALVEDPRLGAVGTQVEAFPEGALGEGLRRYVAWQNGLVTPDDHARDLFVESPLCHPSVMLRRDALDEVGAWREVPWAEDYDLWLRLHASGYRLAKVPRVLLRWRHRGTRATFRDPRYALARFIDAKAHYLAPRLLALGRPVAVWGAGATGKRTARALERRGVRIDRFVDIDPKKMDRRARSAPIVRPSSLVQGAHTIVVAVGARGARDLVRLELNAKGFVDGCDYVCAA